MNDQSILKTERLITHITPKWLFPIMYALMRLQATHVTAKGLLPTMYMLMNLQAILMSKWLITHITVTWTLSTMSQIEVLKE
jgi:hypothetical protein